MMMMSNINDMLTINKNLVERKKQNQLQYKSHFKMWKGGHVQTNMPRTELLFDYKKDVNALFAYLIEKPHHFLNPVLTLKLNEYSFRNVNDFICLNNIEIAMKYSV